MSFMLYYNNYIYPKYPDAEILYMKIDVEGHETAVIKGMIHLLQLKKVRILVAEYAVFWNDLFYNIVRKQGDYHVKLSDVPEPNLKSFQGLLHSLGYNVYLISKQQLVPISGLWWDDFYEFCTMPPKMLGTQNWGWHDVLIVVRGSAEETFILQKIGSCPTPSSSLVAYGTTATPVLGYKLSWSEVASGAFK